MNAFVVSGRIQMEADAARKEVQAYAGTLDAARASATGLGASTDKAQSSTRKMGAATDAAERQVAELRRMVAATTAELATLRRQQELSNKSTTRLGRSNATAAGQVGNLTAQFNDIGVMLAAGQNPLQLAIQQGTQITQVIGPMGAAGAARSLGAALKAMVSPTSLVTLGVIAGGAALVQWGVSAMSAAEGTDKFSDAVSEAKSQVQAYVDLISSEDKSFSARFERAKGQIEATSEAYRDLIALAKIDALQNIDGLTQGLASSVLSASYLKGEVGDAGDLLGIETQLQGNITVWKENREAVRAFVAELKTLQNASDLDTQYQSAIALRDTFKSTVDVSGEMTAEQIAFWRNLSLSIQQMELLGAATQSVSAGASGTARSVDLITNAALAALARVDEIDAGFRNVAATQTTLTAETSAYIKKMATAFEVARDLKAELGLAAFEALRLSGIDLTSQISSAAQQAAVLAANLGISLNNALSLQNLQSSLTFSGRGQNPKRFGDPFKRDPNESTGTISPQAQKLIDAAKAAAARASRSGRKGGASKAEKQRKATQDLIDTLNKELAILRETDPVQQELLRNREALAGATADERTKIEDLITARNAEKSAIDEQRETWESFRSLASETFSDLITSGKSFGDVISDLTAKIADMALQGLLLGEGPLGALLGGKSGAGLIGDIFGPLFSGSELPAAATGGMIYGKGGGRSDDVLMWGSSGEYVVNADATAKNRHLLERINSGAGIQALASGGIVGGSTPFEGRLNPVPIVIENRSSTPVQGQVQEDRDAQGGRRFKLVLADEVGSALTQKGGGAHRTLSNRYQLRPSRTQR